MKIGLRESWLHPTSNQFRLWKHKPNKNCKREMKEFLRWKRIKSSLLKSYRLGSKRYLILDFHLRLSTLNTHSSMICHKREKFFWPIESRNCKVNRKRCKQNYLMRYYRERGFIICLRISRGKSEFSAEWGPWTRSRKTNQPSK